MIHFVGQSLDPEREVLARSISTPSPLDEVAASIAAASEHERLVYVERVEGGYRWSLAHRGGAYPLLRITARFLGVDHHEVVIAFQALDNGVSILGTPEERSPISGDWTLIALDGPTTAADIKDRIERHFHVAEQTIE